MKPEAGVTRRYHWFHGDQIMWSACDLRPIRVCHNGFELAYVIYLDKDKCNLQYF